MSVMYGQNLTEIVAGWKLPVKQIRDREWGTELGSSLVSNGHRRAREEHWVQAAVEPWHSQNEGLCRPHREQGWFFRVVPHGMFFRYALCPKSGHTPTGQLPRATFLENPLGAWAANPPGRWGGGLQSWGRIRVMHDGINDKLLRRNCVDTANS